MKCRDGQKIKSGSGKGCKYGGVSEENAWKMVTLNPAKLLHLDHIIGSIKQGKDADIVIWSDNPLSYKCASRKNIYRRNLFYDLARSYRLHDRDQRDRKRIMGLMLQAKNGGGETQNHPCEDNHNTIATQ